MQLKRTVHAICFFLSFITSPCFSDLNKIKEILSDISDCVEKARSKLYDGPQATLYERALYEESLHELYGRSIPNQFFIQNLQESPSIENSFIYHELADSAFDIIKDMVLQLDSLFYLMNIELQNFSFDEQLGYESIFNKAHPEFLKIKSDIYLKPIKTRTFYLSEILNKIKGICQTISTALSDP